MRWQIGLNSSLEMASLFQTHCRTVKQHAPIVAAQTNGFQIPTEREKIILERDKSRVGFDPQFSTI